MLKRKFGKFGPEVTAFGIGGMSFADFYGPTNQANSFAVLDEAREAGVTMIDTANVYGMGKSEAAIGAYFAERGSASRDQFFIATKASISRNSEGNRFYNNSFEHFEAELDQSLKRLGTDYVDLFYMHRFGQEFPIEEVVGNIGRLMDKGKVKGIGLSEIAPSTLRRAATERHVDAVQSEYSLATRAPELGLLQSCAALGTAFVAFSPVGRSYLTDNPIPFDRVSDLPFLSGNPRFSSENYKANIAATDALRALATEFGMPTAGLAIAWVLAQGEHMFAIPGTRSAAHFKELLAGADALLSQEQLAQIEEVLPVGWAHGDRYNASQWVGPERYC